MHAVDVLMYGNRTLMMALDKVPEDAWETGGVCGWWSVKNIVAHLASFEHMLEDVLCLFLEGGSTETLEAWGRSDFNDLQVANRQDMTPKEVLKEYQQAYEHNMSLAKEIPAEKWAETGALPWYGKEYDLEDFIAYTFYGHKREHSAQVNVFTDQFKDG